MIDVFGHVLENRHSKDFMQNKGLQSQEKSSISFSIFASR